MNYTTTVQYPVQYVSSLALILYRLAFTSIDHTAAQRCTRFHSSTKPPRSPSELSSFRLSPSSDTCWCRRPCLLRLKQYHWHNDCPAAVRLAAMHPLPGYPCLVVLSSCHPVILSSRRLVALPSCSTADITHASQPPSEPTRPPLSAPPSSPSRHSPSSPSCGSRLPASSSPTALSVRWARPVQMARSGSSPNFTSNLSSLQCFLPDGSVRDSQVNPGAQPRIGVIVSLARLLLLYSYCSSTS